MFLLHSFIWLYWSLHLVALKQWFLAIPCMAPTDRVFHHSYLRTVCCHWPFAEETSVHSAVMCYSSASCHRENPNFWFQVDLEHITRCRGTPFYALCFISINCRRPYNVSCSFLQLQNKTVCRITVCIGEKGASPLILITGTEMFFLCLVSTGNLPYSLCQPSGFAPDPVVSSQSTSLFREFHTP